MDGSANFEAMQEGRAQFFSILEGPANLPSKTTDPSFHWQTKMVGMGYHQVLNAGSTAFPLALPFPKHRTLQQRLFL